MSLLMKYLKFSYKRVNKRLLLIALLVFIVFLFAVLPWEAARRTEVLGQKPSPDMSFLYTSSELYEMAESYGPAGRSYYIRARFTFDVIWPLVYFFFLWAGLSYIYREYDNTGIRLLPLLPLFSLIFDLLENFGAALVMYRYPSSTPGLAQITPAFTMFKWSFIYLSFIALFLGLALLLKDKLAD